MAQPERIYTLRELTRLLRLTPKRLQQLRRLGVLRDEAGGYRFRELVAARVAAGLLERGASVRRVREALEGARRIAPEVETPLSELRLVVQGERIVVEQDRVRFDPAHGPGAPRPRRRRPRAREPRVRARRVSCGRSSRPPTPPRCGSRARRRGTGTRSAGSRPSTPTSAWSPSIRATRRRGTTWGCSSTAWGTTSAPGSATRRRSGADDSCCQAAFNLGSLHEDLGDFHSAVTWYRLALEMQPDYADAHFNLAGVLGKLGRNESAARHWRRYLELDLGSPWAQIARSHLEGTEASAEDDE